MSSGACTFPGLAIVAGVMLAGWSARAQEPLAAPAPLVQSAAAAPEARAVATLAAAQRAHDLGLLTAAADLYRELLALPNADRAQHGLALASVLLDAGQPAEAEKVLANIPEPRGPAWQLRLGLAALQLLKRDVVQAQWDALRPEDLSSSDRAWYWFLAGALYDMAPVRDVKKANEYYLRAESAAESELSRARFQLAAEEVRLRLLARPTDADLRQVRENYERFEGRSTGYDFAKTYAVMLAEMGRQPEAIAFLKRITVPRQERAARDEINFVLALIADRGRHPDGRNALIQLLETGANPVRQRQALQLLADASSAEPVRGQFRLLLDRLIDAKPPHPIRESLLFHRAQLALTDKDFVQAEKDAIELRDNFPASPLRVHAFGVLTQSAWEQRRYRLAADNARRAREALTSTPPGQEQLLDPSTGAAISPLIARARARAEFGILEAEASFRAGDFRPAADAYAAVVRDRPPHLPPAKLSALMYQRVLAEIRASPAAGAKVLDDLADEPILDLENRWQAEWSLARALQLEGKTREAYDRVSKLLARGGDATALKPELRARMAWLQAQLSFDAQQYEQTLALVETLVPALGAIDERLKQEIASMVVLLKARAEFELGREAAALATGRRLRTDYPDAEAAIQSFLVEADHFANQEKIDEARLRLTSLVDNENYKNSPHVPYALFHLALLSERLGQTKNLEEANKRIEDLVNSAAAAGEMDLIFAARLKQGDLLRKLNQFPQAQRAYEDLVNRYPRRPDVVLAQLALAECHNAQSAADTTTQMHADIAQQKFEELRDRVDAPRDVRVEAGYNLGALLARRGRPEEAVKVWWRDVITPFLLQETQPMEPDAKRRYWLGRTLLELGNLLEQQGRLDDAKNAYELVLRKQIGHGHALARNALQRLGVPPPKL